MISKWYLSIYPSIHPSIYLSNLSIYLLSIYLSIYLIKLSNTHIYIYNYIYIHMQLYTCVYIYKYMCVCDGMWLYLKIVYITKLTLEQNKWWKINRLWINLGVAYFQPNLFQQEALRSLNWASFFRSVATAIAFVRTAGREERGRLPWP